MSDSEDENLCLYGTLLDAFNEDEIPSKKPISIEDQIATDSHGRRRFHGAFTGGFSAGFCNTVGSLEGWQPKDFKSSRSEKASAHIQRPEDFMDDEDVAEFGFAPQGLRATDDYNSIRTSRKRRHELLPNGPIPGQPVLQLLLEPARETIGVKLLKKMGWKPGQGVGPRQTRAEKKKVQQRMIGCQMPPGFEKSNYNSESDSDADDLDITFAPDDYQPYICQPKENTCGMGYTGLNKNLILSGFSRANEPSQLTLVERNNKKLSIQGQAFGVGAFEEDDEDIYARDDMSTYDFELGEKPLHKKLAVQQKSSALDAFVSNTKTRTIFKIYPPPVIPKSFIPKHGVRISRFDPLPEEKRPHTNDGTNRHNLTAEQRQIILDGPPQKPKLPTILGGGVSNTDNSKFKPFIIDPAKQERYEQYLEFIKTNEKDKLTTIQPITMNEWERERERVEFEQAANMYQPRPTDFLVFDRFVSAQQTEDLNNPLASIESNRYLHGTADKREAAKRKMFGTFTRDTIIWTPSSLLCKRFNVPEPYNSQIDVNQRKTKKSRSVFDYLNAINQVAETKTESITIEQLKSEKQNENVVESIVDKNTDIIHNESISIQTNDQIIETPSTSGEAEIKSIEKITEETVLHTEDKIDLYKAIFLSESESDGDDNDKPDESVKHVPIETQFPVVKAKPTGIFANIDLDALCTTQSETIEIDDKMYGPQLPSSTVQTNCSAPIMNTLNKLNVSDDCDKWIEKSDSSCDTDRNSRSKKLKKKHNHHKKHKKSNKKHKKKRHS